MQFSPTSLPPPLETRSLKNPWANSPGQTVSFFLHHELTSHKPEPDSFNSCCTYSSSPWKPITADLPQTARPILWLFTGPSLRGEVTYLCLDRVCRWSILLASVSRRGLPFSSFFFKEMVCCQGLMEEVVISGQHQWRGTGDLFACRQHVLQEGRLPAL